MYAFSTEKTRCVDSLFSELTRILSADSVSLPLGVRFVFRVTDGKAVRNLDEFEEGEWRSSSERPDASRRCGELSTLSICGALKMPGDVVIAAYAAPPLLRFSWGIRARRRRRLAIRPATVALFRR